MRSVEDRMEAIYKKADKYRQKKKRRKKTTYQMISLAACLLLLIGGSYGVSTLRNKYDTYPIVDNESNNLLTNIDKDNSKDEMNLTQGDGVSIPAIELPKVKKGEEVAMDMIGLVVYQGRIYTQDGYIEGGIDIIEALKGDYLGYAIGNINEWSSQDEYAKELASNIAGEVYSVNGYNQTFRIGIISEYEGKTQLQFFSNMNGINLKNGKDFYEERLQLSKNYETFYYQNHEDWDYAKNVRKEFETVNEDDMRKFIQVLGDSQFVDLYKDGYVSLYSEDRRRAHVYFNMKDNSQIALDLLEGGYVRYENMSGGAFVKIEDDIFNIIFDEATQAWK